MTAIESLRAMARRYELDTGFPPREIALTEQEAKALAVELAAAPMLKRLDGKRIDPVTPECLLRKMRKRVLSVGGITVTTP